jgi:hypothetical protein
MTAIADLRVQVVPREPGPKGPPKGWWTVKRHGIPVRHFLGKEKAERYATDPEYRASLITPKAWAKGEVSESAICLAFACQQAQRRGHLSSPPEPPRSCN